MKSSLCWPDVSSEHSWFFGVYKPRPINMLYMLHFTCYFCPSKMKKKKNGIFLLGGHFLSAERLFVCFGQCGFSQSLIIRLWTSKRKKANRKGRIFFMIVSFHQPIYRSFECGAFWKFQHRFILIKCQQSSNVHSIDSDYLMEHRIMINLIIMRMEPLFCGRLSKFTDDISTHTHTKKSCKKWWANAFHRRLMFYPDIINDFTENFHVMLIDITWRQKIPAALPLPFTKICKFHSLNFVINLISNVSCNQVFLLWFDTHQKNCVQ